MSMNVKVKNLKIIAILLALLLSLSTRMAIAQTPTYSQYSHLSPTQCLIQLNSDLDLFISWGRCNSDTYGPCEIVTVQERQGSFDVFAYTLYSIRNNFPPEGCTYLTPVVEPTPSPSPTVVPSPTISPTPSPTPEIKLSVAEVKFAQVVYNPVAGPALPTETNYSILEPAETDNFTAVQGKSASFEVKLALAGAAAEPPFGFYRVQIKSGQNIVSQSELLNYSTLYPGKTFTISADAMRPLSPLKSFLPNNLGLNKFTAEVINDNTSVKTTPRALTVNVLKTFAPSVGVVRIKSGDLTKYQSTTDATINKYLNLSSYLSAVLPVADKTINITDNGNIDGNPFGEAAFLNDLLETDKKRRYLFLDRLALIVPRPYIKFTLPEDPDKEKITGYRFSMVPKALVVSDSFLSTFSHELGHSFGVRSELYKLDEEVLDSPKRKFNGFHADPTGYLNSTKNYIQSRSFMDAGINTSVETMPWIDNRNYSIIFRNFTDPVIDPKSILVNGIIEKSGKVSQVKLYNIPNGVLTPSVPGDFQVNIVDSSGKILGSVSMQSSFKYSISREAGNSGPDEREGNKMPFAVELPVFESAHSIQLVKNGKILLNASFDGLKLNGIINRIPLDAFKAIGCNRIQDKAKFAQKEKEVLLKIASTAQALLDSKKIELARLSMEGLILAVKATTNDKYYPATIDEISQSSATSEIRGIIKKLGAKNK